MSKVRRMERIKTEVMEPYVDGHFAEGTAEKYAWKCTGCGRVWPMRWHAESCENRGHVSSFKQRGFTRECIRQEAPEGVSQ